MVSYIGYLSLCLPPQLLLLLISPCNWSNRLVLCHYEFHHIFCLVISSCNQLVWPSTGIDSVQRLRNLPVFYWRRQNSGAELAKPGTTVLLFVLYIFSIDTCFTLLTLYRALSHPAEKNRFLRQIQGSSTGRSVLWACAEAWPQYFLKPHQKPWWLNPRYPPPLWQNWLRQVLPFRHLTPYAMRLGC